MAMNITHHRAIQSRLRGPAQEIDFQQYPDGIRTTSVKDHTGSDVALGWQQRADKVQEGIPSFSYQVYVLQRAGTIVADRDLAARFALKFSPRTTDAYCRFDIYGQYYSNALECVEHQRHVVQWRNRNGIWPRLIETWSSAQEAYRGCILVIDTANWGSEGVVIVRFDPLDIYGQASLTKQITTVTATRQGAEELHEHLLRIWGYAGHTWTQSDLARRNDGGFSPALYPAVDPVAREDVEDNFDDTTDLPGPGIDVTNSAEEDANDRDAEEVFTAAELWHNIRLSSSGLIIEPYKDLSGHVIESVWSAERVKTRPPLAFTLYCEAMPTFHSAALFRCLDRRQMSGVPWTLDVVRNFSTLGEALEHYECESSSRSEQCINQRRLCMSMLVSKIAGSRLPMELQEQIQDLLTPPYMPRLVDDRTHCFLYVDATSKQRLLEGPLLVRIEAPDNLEQVQEESKARVGQDESTRECLSITTVRSWDAVTQVMYGYFYQRYYQMRSSALHDR